MLQALLLETIEAEAHALLEKSAEITLAESPDETFGDDQLAAVDVIVTRGRGQVPEALIARCPQLKVIARCGVGLDNIDVAAATKAGVAVINAPGSTTLTTAEHTIGLMIALRRKLVEQTVAVKENDWAIRSRYDGDECAGATLGVVGYGAIGSRVATIADALGMQVIVWNRSDRPIPHATVSLEELLERSDIITLHTALTPDTEQLIGAKELSRMKPGALLINAARGALVDTEALLAALDDQLGGYAADGVHPEPPAENDRLIMHRRTMITPHSAALTAATYRRMCTRTVQNLVAFCTDGGHESESVFNGVAPS